ncbi:alpha/beta fold hydrolase [Amycolatopsis sp. NPDC059027]|uniref:alpha/beta fold hydrolase n=1 Tax=Amycolatopsis sp. NPDC059027 TaxID=3346709 RepID=UPI0036716608
MDVRELEAHRHRVSTRFGEVSYLDVGTGPAALFVHGVGTNARLWRHVVAASAGQRRCVAFDLPGHGHSPVHADRDLSLRGLAELVEEFCAALELAEVDLVANDTGGAVAQVFAVDHPARLRTLTLTNCDTHDNLPPEAFRPTVELAKRGRLASLAGPLVANPGLARAGTYGAGYEHPDQVDDAVFRDYVTPVFGTTEAARGFERLLTSLKADDLVAIEPELKNLRVPTLIVWGTGDENFETRWAYWLRDVIPGAQEVIEVEGAKLFFPDERPDDLTPHLHRHWARTLPR